jgi:hypothetical protein
MQPKINRSINDSYSDDDMGMGFLANNQRTGSRNVSAPPTPMQQPSAPQPMGSSQFNFSSIPQYPSQPSMQQQPSPQVSLNKEGSDMGNAMSERSFGENSYDDSASEMSEVGMNPEDIVKEKRTLLFKLKRYEKKGYKLSRQYSLHSSLEDLRSEYESIRREANLEQGLQVSKNLLISSCSLLEYLNNRFDPMDVVLDGWSEEVHEDVEEGKYDEVLEELYYKYYDKVSIGPELKLLTMLGGSAIKFHMTQTLLKTMVPDAETLLKQNPNLKNDIANLINKNGANPAANLNAQVNNMMFNDKVSGLGAPRHSMKPPADVDVILRDIEKDVDTHSDTSESRRKPNVFEMSI